MHLESKTYVDRTGVPMRSVHKAIWVLIEQFNHVYPQIIHCVLYSCFFSFINCIKILAGLTQVNFWKRPSVPVRTVNTINVELYIHV